MMPAHPKADKGEVIGLLDIGSSKIACAIVSTERRAGGRGMKRVEGIGYQRSRGIKAGVIVNLDEAEAAVRSAVSQAERMAPRAIAA